MLTLAPEAARGLGPSSNNTGQLDLFGKPEQVDSFGKQLVNSGRFDWALEEIDGTDIKRVSDKHAPQMAMLVYNQLKHGVRAEEARQLGVQSAMEDIQTGDLALPTKWSLPIIRRIYPAIFDAPFFATQSMPGPLAYAFFLDFLREVDSTDFRTLAPFVTYVKTTVVAATPATILMQISTKANAIVLTPYQLAVGQSITLSVGTGNVETVPILSVNRVTGAITANTTKTHTAGDVCLVTTPSATAEAGIPTKAKMSLTRTPVTANKWMYAATWSTEAMEDARAQLNLDIEAEMVQALSVEIGRELFGTIITDIVQQATGGSTTIAVRGATAVQDYQRLAFQPIYDAEAVIYGKRYHDADTLLCGVDLATNLLQQDNFHAAPADKSMMSALGVTHLGTFQSKYEIYKTAFLPPNLGLIFQKPTDWLHAGYVYMPYIPLSPMPLVYAGYNTGTGNYQNTDEWTRNIRTRAGRLMTVGDEYGLITQG